MDMQNLLEIGKIVTVFGIKGEVKVQPWCDSPEFLCSCKKLYYRSGEQIKIEKIRIQKNMVIMKIEGINTPEQAHDMLKNKVIYIDKSEIKLEEGRYFIQDLIGLDVIDSSTGRCYGKICEVSQTGANDVYHIKNENGKIYYIPAIPLVIDKTDIENHIMTITPLEGLFDEEEQN